MLRSALAPQDRKVLHHDISIYHPRFQFHVDLDELSPPESGLDGMESPVEGDEQLRGSDMYPLPPAPQAAPLSRDGGVAAPVLDVSVEGAVGRGRVAGAGPNPDGMESPYEGDEQLRGSDHYLPPAPQAAPLSRDGGVAAPVPDVPGNGAVGRGSVVVGRALGELDPAGELGSDESDSSEDLEALDAAASEYSKEVESELLRTVPRRSGETEYELLLRAGFFHDSLDGISPGWFDSAALGYADTWKGGRVFVFPSRAFRTGVA